jgi:hypothetical protein
MVVEEESLELCNERRGLLEDLTGREGGGVWVERLSGRGGKADGGEEEACIGHPG